MHSRFLMYGSAGSRERAKLLAARHEGVYWGPDLGPLIIVDPEGAIRLMEGGGARREDDGLHVWPGGGGEIILGYLCALPD